MVVPMQKCFCECERELVRNFGIFGKIFVMNEACVFRFNAAHATSDSNKLYSLGHARPVTGYGVAK